MTPRRIARQGAWLLPLWVALLGADRIDLLGGRGPFVLTPFLLLTAPVVAMELAARRARLGEAWRRVPAAFAVQAALVFLLVGIAALSTINSLDALVTVQRTLLLAAQAGGASLVIWAIADDPDAPTRLAAGGRLGIAFALVSNLAQGLAFAAAFPVQLGIADLRLVDLQTFNYAGLIPRVSGLALDPNRGAYLGIFHLTLANMGPAPARRWWLTAGAVSLLGTLSRSGLLATGAALAIAAAVQAGPDRESRVVPAHRAGRHRSLRSLLASLLVVSSATLLAFPSARERAADRLAPAAGRLSAAEGSARLHTQLLQRAIAEATRDVPRTLLGAGYGTSFLLLRDVFGTRYGNFHSLYLTFWVETGILATMLVIVLLTWPFRQAGPWRPLLAATIVFNLFYQAGSEPALWASLALAWQAGTAAPIAPRRSET